MIKIIGDVEKAAKALGTNVKLKKDQMLSGGSDEQMKILCQKYPDLFEGVSGNWVKNMKKSPSKNKMMNSNISTKVSNKVTKKVTKKNTNESKA